MKILFVVLLFTVSVLLTLSASAWFMRRLASISARLELPISLLSLLGALGANVPNYASSIVAIANGQVDVGLGIIIGSNIYNVAIILSVSTFATARAHGITLAAGDMRDIDVVGLCSLAIMLVIALLIWLLPGTPLTGSHASLLPSSLLYALIALAAGIFAGLVWHALRRVHHVSANKQAGAGARNGLADHSLARLLVEGVTGLAVALGGVVVMVQSGESLTNDLHIPSVLAGLLVLAVATSLPNTVVAFSLARDGRAGACVEEIFSSNSINAIPGIALPLLFWPAAIHDRLLLFLDAPFMAALTLVLLLLTLRRRIGHTAAILLLMSYIVWVIVHMIV